MGYGKPHGRWFGAESQTRFSLGSASQYFGIRGAQPGVELRLGPRYTWAANQAYLSRRYAYSDDELEYDDNPSQRYATLESELAAALPLLGGAVTVLASGYYVLGVPDDLNIFEEQMHIVA